MIQTLRGKALGNGIIVATSLLFFFIFIQATFLLINSSIVQAAESKCYARNADRKVQHAACKPAQAAIQDKCFLAQTIGGEFTQAGSLGGGTCRALQNQAQGAPEGDDAEQGLGTSGAAGCDNPDSLNDCVKNNPIVTRVLRPIVLFLTAVVAIVIIGSLIVAGIQYSASQDNPQMVQKSKDRIRNALIALAAFMFTFAGLQYLIPGGIINL